MIVDEVLQTKDKQEDAKPVQNEEIQVQKDQDKYAELKTRKDELLQTWKEKKAKVTEEEKIQKSLLQMKQEMAAEKKEYFEELAQREAENKEYTETQWLRAIRADFRMTIELAFGALFCFLPWTAGATSLGTTFAMLLGLMVAEFASLASNNKSLFNNLIVTPVRILYVRLSSAKESEELVIVESKEKSLATQTTVTSDQNSNTKPATAKESEELVIVKAEQKSLLSKFLVNPAQNLYAKFFTPKESRELIIVKTGESLVTRFVNPIQNLYTRFTTAKKSATKNKFDEESPLITTKNSVPINQSYQSMNTDLGGPSTKSTNFTTYEDEDEDKKSQDSSSSKNTSRDTINQQTGTQAAVYSKEDPLEIKCEV